MASPNQRGKDRFIKEFVEQTTSTADSSNEGIPVFRHTRQQMLPPTNNSFEHETISSTSIPHNSSLATQRLLDAEKKKTETFFRSIPKVPLIDLKVDKMSADFYLNLLDWKGSVLGVCIGSLLYFYDVQTRTSRPWDGLKGKIGEEISSFQFSRSQECVLVGTFAGNLKILSTGQHFGGTNTERIVRIQPGFRVTCVDNAHPEALVATGTKNGIATLVSTASASATGQQRHSILAQWKAHDFEICGIKWSKHHSHLLATGGNDNSLAVWDIRSLNAPVHRLTDFQGAVKAIDWCPWNADILAAGGDSFDRKIRMFNHQNARVESVVDTGAQVSALHFYSEYHEVITTHGYTLNDICFWKYPHMTLIERLEGFSNRILQSALNPTLNLLATACPEDGIVNIWSLASSRTCITGKEAFEDVEEQEAAVEREKDLNQILTGRGLR